MRAVVSILLLVFVGCTSARVDDRPREVGVVEEDGRFEYVDLEDGFFGLVTDGGARFVPVDLESEDIRDGLRVRFRGRVQEHLLTPEMWGTPISIEWMTVR